MGQPSSKSAAHIPSAQERRVPGGDKYFFREIFINGMTSLRSGLGGDRNPSVAQEQMQAILKWSPEGNIQWQRGGRGADSEPRRPLGYDVEGALKCQSGTAERALIEETADEGDAVGHA